MSARGCVMLAGVGLLVCAMLASVGCAEQTGEGTASLAPGDGDATVRGALDIEEPNVGFKEVPMHVSDVKLEGGEVAIIETSQGVVVAELYPDVAPNTVASIVELAREGYFDGIKVHRVVPGFVVQVGDPQTRDLTSAEVAEMAPRQEQGGYLPGEPRLGTAGPGWHMAAEFNDRKHLDGTLSMARALDPDSAGSQFFICLGPQQRLDGQYTVFGQVIEGMDIVRSIVIGDEIVSVRIERR